MAHFILNILFVTFGIVAVFTAIFLFLGVMYCLSCKNPDSSDGNMIVSLILILAISSGISYSAKQELNRMEKISINPSPIVSYVSYGYSVSNKILEAGETIPTH